ncbi:MAG TPA: PIG-L deacetylase family protein [Acidimicrobiales bacterium]|nr:PIG-L deacetylase family protein [Acidimicrobiales bacterium]
MRELRLAPTCVLAVYAHPDDADVAAGGLLARLAAEGAAVHLVVVCDGSKGSHGSSDPSSLRAARQGELQLAADLLGATSALCLGQPDGEAVNDAALREMLVGHVRRLRPEVVVGPDPTATFFDGVYVNHRDHRETGWAMVDAVAPAAAMPLYFPDAGPAHGVTHLLLSGTLEADVVYDVTTSIDTKAKAVLAHVSQLGGDHEGVRGVVYARAERAGREIGVAFGEAFRHLELGL